MSLILIAIDCEFTRRNTYWPILSLVQFNIAGNVQVMDVLAADFKLENLKELLSRPARYILHSGEQDLEIFNRLFGVVPQDIVDTQLAAAFAGLGMGVSYQFLVDHFLGIQIDKSMQKTDWNVRPLSNEQIAYAMSDVEHLPTLYTLLTQQLSEKGTLAWFEEDQKGFYTADFFETNFLKIWQKIRLKKNLKGQALALLQDLCIWREKKAMLLDYNKTRVLADATLEILAIKGAAALSPELEYADELCDVIDTSAKRLPETWPTQTFFKKPDENQKIILEKLMAKREAIAQELGLPPMLLAVNSDLKKICLCENVENLSLRCLNGWRAEVIGRPLLESL